jgi:HSP20 family protein
MRKMIIRRPVRRTIPSQSSVTFNGGRRMPLDVAVDEEGYTVLANIPGFSAEEVELKLENDVLTLRTEPKSQEGEERESLWRERPAGAVQRRIRLPQAVDREAIDAWVEDGVLTVRLPKAEGERTRTIKVNGR